MNRNLKLSFTCLFFLTITFFSLQAQKKSKGVGEVERYNPNFSYSPDQRENVANTGLTIALLKPVFIDEEINKAGTPWDEFSKAMANDVEELLTAKGYKVRGPFNSLDEMVYSDKQNCDFVIQISIDLNIRFERKWKTKYNILLKSTTYQVEKADVTMNSSVILTALACFTSEKLWKKNLDISQKSFTYAGTMKWDSTPSFATELKQEINLWNPTCKNLEGTYKGAFDILWKQFDRNEMADIAKEAKKADKERRN